MPCHFFPRDPLVLRFWEQESTNQRAINSALVRENDYIERSFAGNYNSVLAIGQKAQANPATLVGNRRMHQLVSGVEPQRGCDSGSVIKEDLQIKTLVAV
jgi:hypothetical protein